MTKSLTRWPLSLALLLVVLQFSACSKQPESTSQPAKPTEVKNQTYRMIGGRSVVAIVSADELEIRQGGENLVCKYTKQDNKLRVIVNALGTTTAKYFDMTPEGLVGEDGSYYYEPSTYEKVMAQIELNSQLLTAVEKDDSAAIDELLRKGAAVETRDERGSVLTIAIEDGLTNAVAALLTNHADPNRAIGNNGETPLWKAIDNGNFEFVKLLLKHGANPNAKRADGVTHLMLAVSVGGDRGTARKIEHDMIVSCLCSNKVDVNAQDNEGNTALGWSLRSGHLEATRILVSAGADRTIGKESEHDAFSYAKDDEDKIEALRTAEEREVARANMEKLRQMFVGTWRSTDEWGVITFKANGFYRRNGENGPWSIHGNIFTFNTLSFKIIEIDDSHFFLKSGGWAGEMRATRISKD